MRKTIPLIALLIAMCFILTACGSFMEWGNEEEKKIERIDKHTDANGVVYMDIYFVGEETPQSIPLPSGADGTSISFDATYNNDERKTVVTVSFSDGSPDQKFDIKDGAIAKVGLVEYLLNVISIFRNPLAMVSPATVMDVVNVPKG